ncbi:MAG TPA: hypothetical protein VHE59_00425 [Mucilaginibacter sp.]|nr:hypothetical protein [Mucilaginibacter sp.]
MSFLSGTNLETKLKKSLGDDFNPKRIKQVAYELSLGDQVYRTDSPSRKREIIDDKDTQVIINPGQFALLITQEKIEMPNDHLAFISIKFGLKIKGLVNVSGFHIDPGFKGKIIFSVYNAGPAHIIMDKGKPYFLLWLSPLTDAINYDGNHQDQNEISAELIEQLKGDLASPKALSDQIKQLEISITKKTDELSGKKNYLIWLYQALIVFLGGLLIAEMVKSDKVERTYQYGVQAGESKAEFKKEINLYVDSLVKLEDSIKKQNVYIKTKK